MEHRYMSSGFDIFDKLEKNMEDLSNTNQATFEQLFSDSFMKTCSDFNNISELFYASGFEVNSEEDFAAIPDDEWESFIKSNTKFDSWEEMQLNALSQYSQSKMFEGI